jgi:hypothetical protein
MRRHVLGEEHPDTLATAATLAQSLACQGKYTCDESGATLTARLAYTIPARRREYANLRTRLSCALVQAVLTMQGNEDVPPDCLSGDTVSGHSQ